MSSPEHQARAPQADVGSVLRLLDAMLGLLVWAAHFLIVYVAAAVACVLRTGGAGLDVPLQGALTLLTVAAAGLVALHASCRHRHHRHLPDQRFRVAVTTGCDAIAVVAILWQLYPIWLVPACA